MFKQLSFMAIHKQHKSFYFWGNYNLRVVIYLVSALQEAY